MLYILITALFNSTDDSQYELEQSIAISLPDAYSSLEFQLTQLNIIQAIQNADLYLILSDSKLILNSISSSTEFQQVPLLVLGNGDSYDRVFYTESSRKSYFEALNEFLKLQSMKKIGFIYSSNEANLQALEFFKDKDYSIISASLDKNSAQKKVSELLGRFFKSKGITDYLVLVDHTLCDKLEFSFSELKINKKWNIVIYGKECMGYLEKEGSIIIVPEGLENVKSYYDYAFKSVAGYLDLLSKKDLQTNQIKRIFLNKNKALGFSILNIQKGKIAIVGRIIKGEVEINSDIVYPTGNTYREIVAKVPLRLSANTGITNPPGYSNAYQNAKYHQGTYYMLDRVRKTNENFANFDLELFDNITCGVSYFDYNYSRDCYIKIKDELGIVHIPSFYDSAIQTLHQFEDLGINIPIISGMGNNFEGSDISVFKNFFRLVSPSKYCTFQDIFVLKKQGWTNIIVFYSDDSWGHHHYNYLLNFETEGFLNIVNAEKFRKIPFGYKPEMLDDYRAHIKNALDTGCNILMIAMSDPGAFFFIESLTDYGVEFGEFMIFFRAPNAQDAGTAEDGNFKKRKNLLHGTFFNYDSFWEGNYGEQIKAEYKKSKYTSNLPGFYIDTVLTITKTLEYMLHFGKDYEDTNLFIETVRKIKFVGVTGRVSFEKTTHARDRYSCNVYNLYYNTQLDKYLMNWIIKIDPLSGIYFNVLAEEVWYVDPVFYPDTKTIYHGCPYFTENIVDSKVSKSPEFIVNLIILIGSTLMSLIFYFKLKLRNLKPISKISFIKVIDVVKMVIIVIEPLQLITIGPSFKNISRILLLIIGNLSLNLLKFYSIRDKSYWIIYSITIMACYIWIILCIMSLDLFKKILKSKQTHIISIKNFLASIITNYLYIPIVYLASSINSCKKTERRHLDIAFLDYDCNFQCWNTVHINLLIASTSLIIILSPMSIAYRVILQNTEENVLLKSNGKFLFFKNLVSLLVISHSRTLQDKSEIGFAIIFSFLMISLFVFTLKWMPYNYDRINLWIKVVLVCIIWHSFICIADLGMKINENYLAAAYFSGWIFIVLIGYGLHIRLPPSYLVFKKGRTIIQMITLAFKFGYFESLNLNLSRRLRFLRRGRRFK